MQTAWRPRLRHGLKISSVLENGLNRSTCLTFVVQEMRRLFNKVCTMNVYKSQEVGVICKTHEPDIDVHGKC